MRQAAEVVRDVPIVRTRIACNGLASLNVLAYHLLAATASDVGAKRRTANCAAGRSDILPAASADLVADDAAEDAADDAAGNVQVASFGARLVLGPATLLGRADDGARYAGFVAALTVSRRLS
jgi:hypothetical protein